MENIYQQAIADAKALRASAMANAKSALQEAFEPQIKEMVRLKLSEELEEDLEEDQLEETEEGMNFEEDYMEESSEIGENELEEILAELEELTNEDDSYEEERELEEAEDKDGDDIEDETDDEEIDDEESETEETQEITVSLGELKGIIEQLKNLDPALSGGEVVDDEEDMADLEVSDEEDEESISLDEILAELEEEDTLKEKKAVTKDPHTKVGGMNYEAKKSQTELKHAKETIAELTESLNEVNLLNAKLLYMNKIFKAKTLSESQKINVVKAFDKASSVKEVKNTFEILKESMTTKKKSQIHESFGYASKPAGVSPRTNVIESDPFVNRWQKLAGL
jgi:hypothetical protein